MNGDDRDWECIAVLVVRDRISDVVDPQGVGVNHQRIEEIGRIGALGPGAIAPELEPHLAGLGLCDGSDRRITKEPGVDRLGYTKRAFGVPVCNFNGWLVVRPKFRTVAWSVVDGEVGGTEEALLLCVRAYGIAVLGFGRPYSA